MAKRSELTNNILKIISENQALPNQVTKPEFEVLQKAAVDSPEDGPTDYAKDVKKAPKRRADKDASDDATGAKKDNKGATVKEEKDEDADEANSASDDDDKDSKDDKKGDKKDDKKKENPFDKFKKKKSVKEEKDEEDEDDEKEVAEDVSALFAGEQLTEAFKKKAVVIFETAVNIRLEKKATELQEAYETELASQVQAIEESMESKIDGFLSYVVEQWSTDHQLEIERGIRTEIAESMIAGLKSLFEQHSIEIPEAKIDVVEKLSEELSKVKSTLNDTLRVNAQLKESLDLAKRNEIISESVKNMPASQADKIRTLAEKLSFKNANTFTESIQVLKETYASNGGDKKVPSTQLTEELTNGPDTMVNEDDSVVGRYVTQFKKIQARQN
jgi:hypothetical protein